MPTHPSTHRPAPHQARHAARTTRAASAPGTFRQAVARLFGRREVTTFHRCLAVHIHFQAPRSALD